jgi:hypothetical protein
MRVVDDFDCARNKLIYKIYIQLLYKCYILHKTKRGKVMKQKLCHFKEAQYKLVEEWAEKYSEDNESRAIREMIEYAGKKKHKEEQESE